ncbi:MAG: flagellar hook-basal body complex protein, partial [candidate division KSB1 bacterium]|nr:flagellar hook-basal body complex protein [candidate division KSB1 bacterium]
MMRSLYAGVSGLRNHQVRMDVIGNNIANVNTIGFKAGRVTFKEALSQTLAGASRPSGDLGGTNPMQVGLGMSIGSIDTLFVQGSLESTGQMTDLAIQGDGFFIVSDGKQRYYTRVGAFGFGADGRLVYTANGLAVQGRMADANGVIATGATIGDIVLPFGQKAPAKATTSVDFSGNLDASAKPKGTILSSDRLYGIELAGHDSELNGLYARGAANSIVSGLSSGLTTITVTDGGVVGTRTYTYVSTDTAVGDGLFNSLDYLIAEINTD